MYAVVNEVTCSAINSASSNTSHHDDQKDGVGRCRAPVQDENIENMRGLSGRSTGERRPLQTRKTLGEATPISSRATRQLVISDTTGSRDIPSGSVASNMEDDKMLIDDDCNTAATPPAVQTDKDVSPVQRAISSPRKKSGIRILIDKRDLQAG